MQLTPHFDCEEFEVDKDIMPDECIPMYTSLAHNLLEIIRAKVNVPIIITSGYRSKQDNAKDHGVPNSQHVATADYCAADFQVKGMKDMRLVFDWVRQQTNLIWDQLILEHGASDDIIHISLTRTTNRRQALEGKVENLSAYTPWPVPPYVAAA